MTHRRLPPPDQPVTSARGRPVGCHWVWGQSVCGDSPISICFHIVGQGRLRLEALRSVHETVVVVPFDLDDGVSGTAADPRNGHPGALDRTRRRVPMSRCLGVAPVLQGPSGQDTPRRVSSGPYESPHGAAR